MRSIQSVFYTAPPDIAALYQQARYLQRVRAVVLDILPGEAAAAIEVVGLQGHRLRIHAANASWATRLRYMQAAIARALAQRMRVHVDTVEIRVRPAAASGDRRARRPRVLAAASRKAIRGVAATIDDPGLAAALVRLAAAGRDDATT